MRRKRQQPKPVLTRANQTRVNHQIQSPEVRVISDSGEQLGVMSLSAALRLAEEQELDLVEVSPNANPPVAKLVDFAKFRYQMQKAEALQKKNAKKVEVKTTRLSARISDHDLVTKAKQADAFLDDGNLVKIELRMRGREQAFADLAEQQVQKFRQLLTVPVREEVPLKKMGNILSVTYAPAK